jgi:hypothetical protein
MSRTLPIRHALTGKISAVLDEFFEDLACRHSERLAPAIEAWRPLRYSFSSRSGRMWRSCRASPLSDGSRTGATAKPTSSGLLVMPAHIVSV